MEAVYCCELTTTHGRAVSSSESLLRTIPEQLIRNRAEDTGRPHHVPQGHADACLVCYNLNDSHLLWVLLPHVKSREAQQGSVCDDSAASM